MGAGDFKLVIGSIFADLVSQNLERLSRYFSFLRISSFFKKVFRKVLEAGGRVFEPLECGHHWMLWGTFACIKHQG